MDPVLVAAGIEPGLSPLYHRANDDDDEKRKEWKNDLSASLLSLFFSALILS
jgi:hypothetical protein